MNLEFDKIISTIKNTVIIFSAGVIASHLYYWFTSDDVLKKVALRDLTVYHFRMNWGWFLLLFTILMGVHITWNTITGMKHDQIIAEADKKARKIKKDAELYKQQMEDKYRLMMEEQDRIFEERVASEKMELINKVKEVTDYSIKMEKKLRKAEHLINNAGRFTREHRLLMKLVKKEIDGG